MDLVVVEGRVLPEVREVSIPRIDPIHFKDPNGFEAEFKFIIENGKVFVTCNVIERCEDYVRFCIIRAYECATALIDIFAFSKGWALSLILDTLIQNDVRQRFALSEQNVQAHCTVLRDPADFQEVCALVLPNLNLRFAFHDLVSSLSTLNYSAIAACRAVEVVRDLISPDMPDDRAWKLMRKKLNIERSYLQLVTDASRKPRHGNRGATDGRVQMEVTNRAWVIMNRYLEFMKRGGQDALPSDFFAVLKA
jgi:hypothetical protein